MTRQQRRFEARKGERKVGLTLMHAGKKYRLRVSDALAEHTAQRFKMLNNGGYLTYHPTKGWRRVSPKRLRNFPGLSA